jgi:hypothetical protein
MTVRRDWPASHRLHGTPFSGNSDRSRLCAPGHFAIAVTAPIWETVTRNSRYARTEPVLRRAHIGVTSRTGRVTA